MYSFKQNLWGPAWLSGKVDRLGSNHTRSSESFVGVSLGKTLQSPSQPSTGETQERHE